MFRAGLISLAILTSGCATSSVQNSYPDSDEPFLTFWVLPWPGARSTTVEIGYFSHPDSQKTYYWIRRTTKTKDGTVIDWADTHSCPNAEAAIAKAAKITPPSIRVPFQPIDGVESFLVVGDGVHYEIKARAHYAGTLGSDIQFSSNFDTPLAEWVDETLEILRPCWRAKPSSF